MTWALIHGKPNNHTLGVRNARTADIVEVYECNGPWWERRCRNFARQYPSLCAPSRRPVSVTTLRRRRGDRRGNRDARRNVTYAALWRKHHVENGKCLFEWLLAGGPTQYWRVRDKSPSVASSTVSAFCRMFVQFIVTTRHIRQSVTISLVSFFSGYHLISHQQSLFNRS